MIVYIEKEFGTIHLTTQGCKGLLGVEEKMLGMTWTGCFMNGKCY